MDTMTKDDLAAIVGTGLLYHGSGIQGITHFREAEEDTLGSGAYFTSEVTSAEGYARGRARQATSSPTVYSVSVEGLRFIDLRDRKTLDVVMDCFADILRERLNEPLPWNDRAVTENAIDAIRKRDYSPGRIRNVTWSHCARFSDYLQSLGYSGLIALEGGEGDYVGNHDTWLVFNPSQLSVVNERTLE